MLAWVIRLSVWLNSLVPLWIESRWPYGSDSETILRYRSQSASVFSYMKSNSLASDHHTLRYAESRATTYFK